LCSKAPASIRFADMPDYGRVYYLDVRAAVRVAVYMLQTRVSAAASTVFSVLHVATDAYCAWNAAVLQLRVVCTIDAHTDVTHSVSAPAMRGAVASRDFLDVRQWRVGEAGVYTIVNESVFANLLPSRAPRSSTVRGTNGPNYWRLTPSDSGAACRVEWLQNTNLRGSLPRRLLHAGMQTFLLDFARALDTAAQRVDDERRHERELV